ncbi:hypothetical protein FACS1894202_03800 [Clostridia bacterium]|nr:hypothetical protein FACS1894202_03800 [Clostridia bacterium]
MVTSFSDAVKTIMPLVNDGDKSTPFIIQQQIDSESQNATWVVSYPYPAQDGLAWLAKTRETDPNAVTFTGAGFARGSFSYVHDKIICARLRAEYEADPLATRNPNEYRALIIVLEDNFSYLSQNMVYFILELERPLHAIDKMNSVPLYYENADGEPYSEAMVKEFADALEYKVQKLIDTPKDSPAPRQAVSRDINGYDEKIRIPYGGCVISLAEKPGAAEPYLVCDVKRDNPFGIEEAFNVAAFSDQIGAMRELTARIDSISATLEAERAVVEKIIEPATPKAEKHAAQRKSTDLLGKISDNKQKVEQYKAANKDAKKLKRDGQEV